MSDPATDGICVSFHTPTHTTAVWRRRSSPPSHTAEWESLSHKVLKSWGAWLNAANDPSNKATPYCAAFYYLGYYQQVDGTMSLPSTLPKLTFVPDLSGIDPFPGGIPRLRQPRRTPLAAPPSRTPHATTRHPPHLHHPCTHSHNLGSVHRPRAPSPHPPHLQGRPWDRSGRRDRGPPERHPVDPRRTTNLGRPRAGHHQCLQHPLPRRYPSRGQLTSHGITTSSPIGFSPGSTS